MNQPVLASSGFFNIDGVSLEYQRLTPSQSVETTLIFLHEGLGCVALWKDFPSRVSQLTGCPALIYSRAGYGRSSPCLLPRPTTFMHDEGLRVLPKMLDAAGIESAVLVGHSDGASIAIICAGGREDPRIRGLVLLAPHVFVEELTLSSIRQAASDYRTTSLRDRLARYHGDNVDCAFWGWNNVWLNRDFRGWNLEEYLAGITVPTLLIQGEDDNYGTLRQLEKIEEGLTARAERVLLQGCGHSPFRERPKETQQAIDGFLRAHFTGHLDRSKPPHG